MKQIYRLILISYFILQASSAFSAQTDCPVQLALTYTNGDTVTTQVNYEVHFYSALTGGTEIATAETDSLIPSGGVLVIPITCDTTLLSHPNIFLEFIINGETLTPRVEMASTPFAGTAFAVAGNSINLGTDTVGSYVQSLTAGTGISITGGSGEGATPTISATGLTLSAGDVTSTIILDGTIAAVDLADGSVTSAKIVDGTITNTDIVAAAGIPYSKLTFTDNIVAGDIATSAVTTTEILDATITSTDVAADAFDFTSLADNMTLDTATNINAAANDLTVHLTGVGDFSVVSVTDEVILDIDSDGAAVTFGPNRPVGFNSNVTMGNLNMTGNLTVSGIRRDSVQSVTVPDSGGPGNASFTVTPTSSYIEVTCNDGTGCDATMSEAGAQQGQIVTIVNITAAASVDFADSVGVQEIAGAFSLGQWDCITLRYTSDRWIEVSRSNN